ncbi:hypothetical protein C1646_738215 [Rhizophagus diaphanus]|nr:hypothetical protein C1646_738215 [Rhizophagus diaphanus] [Rhizophagus sp. MUCL 43196]
MSMDIVELKPTLLKDLKNLYKNLEKDNNNDYNVTIKVEQKSFKAHSVILKLRSEYFRNLINNEIKRMANMFNKKITLEISDMNSEVFSSCLKYIYTGEFSLQGDNDFLFDLFIAAEKLKLIDMVDYLQNYFIENKTEWIEINLIRVYQISLNSISFNELQVHCKQIIDQNPKFIFLSDSFHTLKSSILLDLIKRDDEFLTEIKIWRQLIKWVHEQEPPINRDTQNWNPSNIIDFEERIRDFIPHIRFFTISSDNYYSYVRPYKEILPQKLVDQLERFYLVRDASPPPNALRPRTPRRLRRKISTYSMRSPTEPTTPAEPRLQRSRSHILAKVPIVNRPPSIHVKPISNIINIRQMRRISHWIDRVESGNINNDFVLLAKGTWDSTTQIKFHDLCDNKGPTLILARIDNTNDIIGGYNPHSWTSSNKWIGSTESFIFSFKSDSREGIDDIIFSRINDQNAAIFDGDSNSNIGFGLDLLLFTGEYKHVHYQRRIMDCDTFTIERYEVFQIRKKY